MNSEHALVLFLLYERYVNAEIKELTPFDYELRDLAIDFISDMKVLNVQCPDWPWFVDRYQGLNGLFLDIKD